MRTWISAALLLVSTLCSAQPAAGYLRFPSVNGDTVVFTAEGDLWRTTTAGGAAARLTSRAGDGVRGAISPDGKWLAFTAAYDGPAELYVMPLSGGVPRRLTWSGEGAQVRGWTPGGEILVSTSRANALREPQLAIVSPATSALRMVALADARDGALVDPATLVFTRYGSIGDNYRGYRGGLTATLWHYGLRGDAEARPLTKGADGNAHDPMAWRDRIVFLSDRGDGVTNVWTMDAHGGDLRQLTHHRDFEVRSASLSGDRVVYEQAAALHVLDLSSGTSAPLPVSLVSDFDQMREQWVRKPLEQFTNLAVSSTGNRVALTARGHVALAGVGALRRVDVYQPPASRLRNAVFMPDGKNVLAVSDASGENELWLLPADGRGPGRKLTSGADVMRWQAVPSPDGRWIAHDDKNGRLWLLDVATGKDEVIERRHGSDHEFYAHFAWSPDSQALAVEETPDVVELQRHQVVMYRIADRSRHVITSGRYSSGSPVFGPDGRWLWFISSRDFQALGGSPWGDRNMGPYFDRREGVYAVALQPGQRFPFQPVDELESPKAEAATAAAVAAASSASGATPPSGAASAGAKSKTPAIVWDGLAQRLHQVPMPAGNYADLDVDAKRLWLLEAETGAEHKTALKTVALGLENNAPVIEQFLPDVREFALSADRAKVAVRRWAKQGAGDIFLFNAEAKAPADTGKFAVRVDDWQFAVEPVDEWRQMFLDAWRMHRDWFYDPTLHGVDWLAARHKYEALLPRVTDRAELEDLTKQMVAELSLMHSQVAAGQTRRPEIDIRSGVLGADFERVPEGARVQRIWRGDPERVFSLGPLARPGVEVAEGDVITAVDGKPVAAVPDIAILLRDKAGKQVLLDVLGAHGAKRHVIVVPAPSAEAHHLRDVDWQWERRRRVAAASNGAFGYLHLDAMGAGDLSEFVREFYAASTAEGLVIDVRDNDGGNIDSIVIEKLMRRAWEFWQARDGSRTLNMQDAFRGNLVVIVNQGTYSDGETFAEGIKRLKLGTLVGMRTAGAGVWLDNDNRLADGGIARAAQDAQVSFEGQRLVEGVGVVPDIEVDNLPHATFDGQDAQLDMAIQVLKDKRAASPLPAITPYAYPPQAR